MNNKTLLIGGAAKPSKGWDGWFREKLSWMAKGNRDKQGQG